uniref:FTP domain-containing protein n=1 Tax=Macrostomum lignano TaxID=282301 RepID=A0A1I8GDW5_9PLAT
ARCRGVRLADNGGSGGVCALLSSELEVNASATAASATDCTGDRVLAWKPEQLQLSGCSESSTLEGNCNNAIDGSVDQNHNPGAVCTHTDRATVANEWWQASMTSRAFVSLVRIYNRQDCCETRLKNFAISVDGLQCASYNSTQAFSIEDFPCEQVGTTLKVTQRFSNEFLTLCELQLSGCSESSTLEGNCNNAIDGSLDQNHNAGAVCTHTQATVGNEWWQASMASRAFVSLVRIYNRQDDVESRLNNFAISVDGLQCASYNSTQAFSIKDFPCEQVGTTLKVTQRFSNEFLTLCESSSSDGCCEGRSDRPSVS